MSGNVVQASARGVSFLILVQVLSRALTFGLNQSLLRYMSPALFGAATQLDLYVITVLYFSRESIRFALQRHKGLLQITINTAFIPICLGTPLIIVLGEIYKRSSLPDVPYMRESLGLYALSAAIELWVEPSFAVAQQLLLYKLRAQNETFATIARCLSTFACVVFAHRNGYDLGVLPFAVGQLCFACSLLFFFASRVASHIGESDTSLLIRKLPRERSSELIGGYFSKPLLGLAMNIYIQSSVKYILTEGDGILIAALTNLAEQGAFAIAANYGSLVARMLFQPIEESSRNMFSKLCSTREEPGKIPNGPSKMDKPQSGDGNTQAISILQKILKLYGLLSVFAFSVGPHLAPLALSIIAGKKWRETNAGEILATYCYYVPFLAFNGITEAFVAAVASNTDLQRQSMLMVLYFAAFASAAYYFLHILNLGAQGIIWANCVNMGLRIAWNTRYISAYFQSKGHRFSILESLPSAGSFAAAAAAGTLLRRNASGLSQSLTGNLLWSGLDTVALLCVVALFERRFLRQCYDMFQVNREAKI